MDTKASWLKAVNELNTFVWPARMIEPSGPDATAFALLCPKGPPVRNVCQSSVTVGSIVSALLLS